MLARLRSSAFFAVACLALLCAGTAAAQVAPDGRGLKAGQFAWLPDADAPGNGPVTMLVNLQEQRGYLYRDGRRIAVTTVSTGRRGHDTPTGVFPILGKERMHYSKKY